MSEDSVPFGNRDSTMPIDDLLSLLADAIKAREVHEVAGAGSISESHADIVNNLMSQVFESNQETGVLGNFILTGEVIGEDGKAHLMVVTSENLPEWIARGMLMAAESYIMDGCLE